ncbi:hypothetical protein BGI40_05975 [Snodgrassella communis]|uniref:Uncharacterized protein n=1 Tax=Snodgrassella communis TaxID=2946699 RepID=A0A836Z5B3_9NEIS|nr:hypothetical protein [Snodgrassella communis]KDN14439.1 hypothetical protein SALWKB29_1528 [Snodgrassella communis]PIT06901.1 hypothetical protein BGI29_10500 [Snodgrassella communis]PIT26547.1 hypothetical protein BGI39_09675 [Snodgrassella communis]PIT29250.1 hypothetical protein BGI38_03655 [Snodgrassella communis]PIT33965.1 hypothetical protein BGI40_05975 [Snodgrassella communis]
MACFTVSCWHAKVLNVPGLVRDRNELAAIEQYDENYSAVIPLPPPAFAGDDFGKVAITVHFLACNQLYITYGTVTEGKDTPMHYKLFANSQ